MLNSIVVFALEKQGDLPHNPPLSAESIQSTCALNDFFVRRQGHEVVSRRPTMYFRH